MTVKRILSMIKTVYRLHRPVINWRIFSVSERRKGCKHLFSNAGSFSSPVFVAGCQRSGTTLVARMIRQSEQFYDISFTKDDELDGAYILAGNKSIKTKKRFCFQTTYVNECFREYAGLCGDFRLIWVVRNPYSVIYSMVYNWARFPLDELFKSIRDKPERRCSAIEKACHCYTEKNRQARWLLENIDNKKIMLVEYDELVRNKNYFVKKIFDFIGEEFMDEFVDMISDDSIDKSNNLSSRDVGVIRELCDDSYRRIKKHCISKEP